ncbi:MAG TPA: hypothetical protein VGQ13_01105 [Nitrososphaera sp.]|jgi:hypothetical protein|nr:hypothetical protein [Nitrososphaera sp.]
MTIVDPNALVKCQLCFSDIEPALREHHLKEVHKISAAAIDNNKPLTHWFRPAASATE